MITKIVPSINEINNLKTRLEDGELKLLNRIRTFLGNIQSREFEIYVQPYINGYRPDIMVVEISGAITLLEVKDYRTPTNLNQYFISRLEKAYFQVNSVRQRLIELSPELLLKIKNCNERTKYLPLKSILYFHNLTEEFFDPKGDFETSPVKNYKTYNTLTKDFEESKLERLFEVVKCSKYQIGQEVYGQISRFLQPAPWDLVPQTIPYTRKQLEIIEEPLNQNGMKKVWGEAGTGKSEVLARRVAKAYERERNSGNLQPRILILTYNITLQNQLRDRISEIQWEKGIEFNPKQINISYFQMHMSGLLITNELMSRPGREDGLFKTTDLFVQNHKIFESKVKEISPDIKDHFYKYDAIFIDEVQDYPVAWQRFLKDNILKNNQGEFYITGDPKQNIYSNDYDEDRKTLTIVQGRPVELKETKRLMNGAVDLANRFSRSFFNTSETIEPKLAHQMTIFDSNEIFDFSYEKIETFELAKNRIDDINREFNKRSIHPNDIVFLGLNKSELQSLIPIFENELITRTVPNSMEINGMSGEDIAKFEKTLKIAFNRNTGRKKLTTVNSYKGWEGKYVVLLLSHQSDSEESESLIELVYTGITRATKELRIINLNDNIIIHNFFNDYYNSLMKNRLVSPYE